MHSLLLLWVLFVWNGFFEAIWHGEGIGDGGDLEEPDRATACAAEGADPHIERFASFEAYLDNDDAVEIIPVTSEMISSALPAASA